MQSWLRCLDMHILNGDIIMIVNSRDNDTRHNLMQYYYVYKLNKSCNPISVSTAERLALSYRTPSSVNPSLSTEDTPLDMVSHYKQLNLTSTLY